MSKNRSAASYNLGEDIDKFVPRGNPDGKVENLCDAIRLGDPSLDLAVRFHRFI
jgi:hypothetical protein